MTTQPASPWLDRLKALKAHEKSNAAPHPLTMPQGMRYDAGVSTSKVEAGIGVPQSRRNNRAQK